MTLDFSQRVQNNGVKLKNLPGTKLTRDTFQFSDYVAKDPSTWAHTPEEPTEVNVEQLAEEMYSLWNELANEYAEITVETFEDDMYRAIITVEIPDDDTKQERLAEQVAEAIFTRQQL